MNIEKYKKREKRETERERERRRWKYEVIDVSGFDEEKMFHAFPLVRTKLLRCWIIERKEYKY